MDLATILAFIQTASIVIGIIVAVFGLKDRGDDKTVALTKMQVDIEYIKRKVDGFEDMKTEVQRISSSVASAHHRIDDHIRYEHHREPQTRED